MTTLGDIVEFQRGYDITKNIQSTGTIPVVSSSGINSYHNEYKVKGPGVVIGRKGTLGTVFFVKGNYWPHDTTLYVKDFKGNDPKFIYYFLKTLPIKRLDVGSANPTLNRNYLHLMKAHVPSLANQKSIAAILTAIDSKIELNNRINAELEVMAKLIYDYWFVQFDFPISKEQARAMGNPKLEGKPYKASGGKMVWNQELKREVPEGWEAKKLHEFVPVATETIAPNQFPDQVFKHLSIPSFDEVGGYKAEKGDTIMSNKFLIREFDVLVSKLNPWFNRVVYASKDADLVSSTEFVVWRPAGRLLKNYLYFLARTESFISYCTRSAAGTSNSHKRVNPTVMMRYEVAFNETVSHDFGTKVEPILKKQFLNQQENRKLSEFRDWILPMLMNGQVSIKDLPTNFSDPEFAGEELSSNLTMLDR